MIGDLKVYGQYAMVYWEEIQATVDWCYAIQSALEWLQCTIVVVIHLIITILVISRKS